MANSPTVERCFVIGPIGDQLAEPGSPERESYEAAIEVFENVIQAACTEFGIEAYRSDDIDRPGEINQQIFEALRTEPFVIADLTGANPNVMYELGLRHTVNMVTIQIGEKGRLPFDITTIRTIKFTRSRSGLINARKALAKAIGTTLAHGFDPPTATRVWMEGSGAGVAVRDLDEVLGADATQEPEEALGFLELMADMEEAMPRLNDQMNSLAALTTEIGELTALHGEKLQRAGTGGQRVGVVHRFANDLDPLVKRFDQESVEAASQARLIDGGLHYLLQRIREDASEQTEEARQFLGIVTGMGDAARGARDEGLLGFYAATENLLDVSAKLRPVIRLLRSALERLVALFDQVIGWGGDAASVLEQLPPSEAGGDPHVTEDPES